MSTTAATVDYERQLKSLREEAQVAERTKVQLETKKEEAIKRKADLEAKCDQEGVNPGELGEELTKLEKKIEQSMKDLRTKLPQAEVDDNSPAF